MSYALEADEQFNASDPRVSNPDYIAREFDRSVGETVNGLVFGDPLGRLVLRAVKGVRNVVERYASNGQHTPEAVAARVAMESSVVVPVAEAIVAAPLLVAEA